MYRLLIRGEPVGIFQHLYLFENNSVVDSLGVKLDMLDEIAFQYINKYNITQIDLSGSRSYMEGIERSLKTYGIENYSARQLTFRYV